MTRRKIDWPVMCAFVCIACLFFLQGRTWDDPAAQILFAALFIAWCWLGVGLARGLWRKS